MELLNSYFQAWKSHRKKLNPQSFEKIIKIDIFVDVPYALEFSQLV